MAFYFGAPRRLPLILKPPVGRIQKEERKKRREQAAASGGPMQTLYKRFRYLIFDSKDPDPAIRAKEESVYRTYFVYPGTDEAIEEPARHLVWYFFDDPDDPYSTVSSVNNEHHKMGIAPREWKDPKNPGKKKKADVVIVKYKGHNRTILYQGSTKPPTFYMEVYNSENPNEPLKKYGMIATSFTPPPSPSRSTEFGKKGKLSTLNSLKKDLKLLMKM